MRVLAIENYPQTSLGLIGEAIGAAGYACDIRRMHAGEELPPSHHGFDALVMLGGAQSALDDAEHPYLAAEVTLARSFGEAGKAVLGVCLGAQLLARGYGAQNLLGRPYEFGWHPVWSTPGREDDPVIGTIAPGAPLFHWHADTFTLPPDAVHLASSAVTEIQAFRLGRAVYGIQFHFEADTALVESWTEVFADEIATIDPDWGSRHRRQAAEEGRAADAAGRALADAWVALIG